MTDEEKGSLNAKIMGGLVLAAVVVAGVFFFKSTKKEKGVSGVASKAKSKKRN